MHSGAEVSGLVGRMVDERYELLEIIGSGAMGVVFRARQVAVGRDVAVKVLSSAWRDHPAIARRFENEARVIAGMRHPAILRLIDQGRFEDGSLYIVTDLLDGDPLDRVLERGPLGVIEALGVLIDVADALSEAHAAEIVHRDLKPANLVLEHVGDRRRVRILDFGIARVPDSQLTATNVVCGTPGYMAPEQILGGAIDGRTDLYALGCVAYECLTAQPVFSSPVVVELLSRHVSEPAPRLPQGTDRELAELVARMLAKDPEQRPASAIEVREALIRIKRRIEEAPFDPRSSMMATELALPKVQRRAAPPRRSTSSLFVVPLAILVAAVFGIAGWMLFVEPRSDRPAIMPPPAMFPQNDPPQPAARVLPMLTIISRPSGARVSVNGKALGTTPLVRRLDEDLERVQLALALDGYQAWSDVLRRSDSGNFTANITLSPGLDVRGLLARPGTKLLAVDFFASWCKPCVAEIPRWVALQKRLRGGGFYFVTVVTQDPGLACEEPGFESDLVICDADGSIAREFGAAQLPATHLWSWQGELLVKRGRVAEVEAKVNAWIKRAPRVTIRAHAPELDAEQLASISELLRAAISERRQLTVVATAEERRQLDEVKKESFQARYDENTHCKVGRELSANTVLQAQLVSGLGDPKLSLKLLSVDDGCLVASSLTPWPANDAKAAVEEAVRALMAKLIRDPERP